MIRVQNHVFQLDTAHTSYVFGEAEHGHLEHLYYGASLPLFDIDGVRLKHTAEIGGTVRYREDTERYSLDTLSQEYSGIGKGDYRHAPLELLLPDGTFTTDFVYDSHTVTDGAPTGDGTLPFATGRAQTLTVHLIDRKYAELTLDLVYTVFEECDVIARHVELTNNTGDAVYIRKLMSFMMDLPRADYTMVTLDGGWAKEAHMHERAVSYGLQVNDSTVGASSNRHNPAFLLKARGASELHGEVLGFNLVYSGNHYSAVEQGNHDTLRVMSGISPHCFLWKLHTGERFVTPQAVMSYTTGGTNALADNMHRFVNEHIIREAFRYTDRPVVINNWEADFFHFNRRKLLALAKKAKTLGVEMFVLDDGWFGKRDSETAGLGDWTVNRKKLRGGLPSLVKAINKKGLRFGLWFEPECVNADSDLYRMHPEWAVTIPGREPSIGRHQMVLDLTRPEVRDYIVESVSAILSTANIEYVKWDYNRQLSDMYSATLPQQGEFFHRYICGLYEVLRRLFVERHPTVLLEGCSSGGNRFDLGMLCFAPQIWTSDNTDAAERLDIQRGITQFYPLSTVSNHVSMTPNLQTLRITPLSTRFHVAAYGVLGYELDFREMTPWECKAVKRQIAFYKEHRRVFQYGTFTKCILKEGERESWQVTDGKTILASLYNLSFHTSPARDILTVPSAKSGRRYTVESLPHHLPVGNFGGMLKYALPVVPKPDGWLVRTVHRHYALPEGAESYECSGEALRHGIGLAMQFTGAGFDTRMRLLGDWGSNLYVIKEQESKE